MRFDVFQDTVSALREVLQHQGLTQWIVRGLDMAASAADCDVWGQTSNPGVVGCVPHDAGEFGGTGCA